MSMLENEKYKGDALLQKSYTVDFFTKKRAPSKGEIQMFYVEDDRMTTMLSFERYKVKGVMGCVNRHVEEEMLVKAYLMAWNALVENRETFIEQWTEQLRKWIRILC